jgi:protein-disulfide isomerase
MTPPEDEEQDLTRKQRREQARAERKAAEEAVAAGAARRRRLTQLGGAVVVVVVAVIVILVATGGTSGSKTTAPKTGSKVANEELAVVKEEIEGVPQKGNVLGASTAPVTLQYFGDLECPICKEFTLGALPQIIQKWVRAGKLRVEYHSLETATREPETFRTQQSAALAAGKQDKMWWFVELFYHEQGEEDSGYVTESYIQGLAKQVPGMNLAEWQAARGSSAWQTQIENDAQEANNRGFTGTPSFLIGHTGGAFTKLEYSSLKEPTSFNEAIEKLIKA